MGQFRAQLENEIDIARAVSDLASHSGDTEHDVSLRLVQLIENAERSTSALSFFRHEASAIDGAKGKGATRKARIYTGAVTSRLRDKAEASGLYAEHRIQLANIHTDKAGLTALLSKAGIEVPPKWIGTARPEAAADVTKRETTSERDLRILARLNELKAQGIRNFRKQVADEERLSVARITQIVRRAKSRDDQTSAARGNSSDYLYGPRAGKRASG